MKKHKPDAGITLIELLVVMVIISLFATLVGQRLFRNVDAARTTTAEAQIRELETSLGVFRLEVGRFPSTAEGLEALRVQPADAPNWDGPYVPRAIPLDPWDRPYVYRSPGQHGDFDLFSHGADGQEGGEGVNADIVNW